MLVFLVWEDLAPSKSRIIVSDDEHQKRTFLRKHEIVECTIVEFISRSIILFGILSYSSLSDFNRSLAHYGERRRRMIE